MPITEARPNSVPERALVKPVNPVAGSTLVSSQTITQANPDLTIWLGTTSDAVETELLLSDSTRLSIEIGQTLSFKGVAAIYDNTNDKSAQYLVEGVFLRDTSGTVAQIDYPVIFRNAFDTGMDAVLVKIEADDTNKAVVIKVTGIAATDISYNITGVASVV